MAAQVGQLLQKYLDVEQHFVSRSMDDAVLEMVKANKVWRLDLGSLLTGQACVSTPYR